MSDNVSHIWATMGTSSEESIIFIKFLKYYYSHKLCPIYVPKCPPDVLCCRLVHSHGRKLSKEILNPHDQVVLMVLLSALYSYSELSYCRLKSQNYLLRTFRIVFVALNDEFSGKEFRAEMGTIRTAWP
jgi:hypothetical protein